MTITTTTLQDLFSHPYQRSAWLEMLGTLLPTKQFATPFFRENSTVAHFYQLGSIDLAGGKQLGVYEIKTHSRTQLQRNRVQMRQLVAKECRSHTYDGALAVYYDDRERWRFSFISMEYKLDEQGQLDRSESAPKRYTYLLGEGAQIRTAVQRFSKLDRQATLQDLVDAFAVEQLNKEFYQKLFEWYEDAKTRVAFPNDLQVEEDDHKSTSLIRLLTRLLFVWFIKEKQLINADLFDEEKVRTLIHWDKESSYYKAVLQNLFFATLNQEIEDRGFRNLSRSSPYSNSYLVTNRYRYRDHFRASDEQPIIDLFARIPFLNGGLFECLDREATAEEQAQTHRRKENKAIRIDGFSDRADNALHVPNELFFRKDENEPGLIDLFQQYQFTAEESTPVDQEVALDPELLGQVFENLLASYNPETGETARKQTGSFYTPREIVNYMVEETLVAALAEQCHPTDGDCVFWQDRLCYLLDYARDFDDAGELFDENESENIVRAIARVKVLDPAVGSGAFPMGVLHKLTLALQRLDGNNERWKKLQKEKAMQKTETAFGTKDQQERDVELLEISETFENYSGDFGRKLYLIQNSIFGVDIQPIACQIAKLRFFISLAIEQEPDESKVNFGIKPLPNLETRFVAADTLISLKATESPYYFSDEIEMLKAKLADNRERHFHATTRQKKLACRDQDKKLRNALAEKLRTIVLSDDDAGAIAQWDPYDPNEKADWFDAGYMFGIADGFDGVIGNPPYVQLQKDGGRLGRLYQACHFESFTRTGDIYCLFYERALLLLKEGGHVCFITSNKWMRAGYGKKLRDYFIARTQPVQLLDMGPDVFEATVDTSILLLHNVKSAGESFRAVTVRGDLNKTNGDMARYLSHQGVTMIPPAKGEPWTILSPAELALKQKIERVGKPLKEWDISINRGIVTGYNPAFIIDNQTRERLIHEDPKSAELIKPVLRGRDIGRYLANWAGFWLIDTHNGFGDVPPVNVDNYGAIERHLGQFYPQLEKRQDKGVTPYNLRNCAFHSEFEKEKIVWKRIGSILRFAYSRQPMLCLDSTCIATGEKIKFLTAVLNSRLSHYQLFSIAPKTGTGDLLISVQALEPLLVPTPNNTEERTIVEVFQVILKAMATDPSADTSKQEEEIDQLVYEMYGLTMKEIEVVEERTRLKGS